MKKSIANATKIKDYSTYSIDCPHCGSIRISWNYLFGCYYCQNCNLTWSISEQTKRNK